MLNSSKVENLWWFFWVLPFLLLTSLIYYRRKWKKPLSVLNRNLDLYSDSNEKEAWFDWLLEKKNDLELGIILSTGPLSLSLLLSFPFLMYFLNLLF